MSHADKGSSQCNQSKNLRHPNSVQPQSIPMGRSLDMGAGAIFILMPKDAYYFSHDSNARHDPKLGAVRAKYGWAGYGLYWAIIECLRDQDNYSYPNSLLYGLALAIGYDPNNPFTEDIKFDEFISFLIGIELLKNKDGVIFSSSLINRMKAFTSYRERLSESGKIGALKRWGGHKGANATQIAVKESKVKESKVLNNRFKTPTLEETKNFFSSINHPLKAEDFYDHFESNGWLV